MLLSMYWVLALAANLVIGVVAYVWACQIARSLFKVRGWPNNPIAIAFLGIVLTCSTGHFEHAAHLAVSPAARHLWTPFSVVLDVITATGIAAYYYFQSGRLAMFARGAGMFEDMAVRRSTAMEIHDDVVQRLAAARYAIDRGDLRAARELVDEGLGSARSVIGELLPPDAAERSGAVRRGAPASVGEVPG